MITPEYVYGQFRKAQAEANNRGYRIPKDLDISKFKSKKQDKFLVFKRGNKNSSVVFDDKLEAEIYISEHSKTQWKIVKNGNLRAVRCFSDKKESENFMKENRGKGYRTQIIKPIKYIIKKEQSSDMLDQHKNMLILVTSWFLTKWQNVDPFRYFQCGFELYNKTFTYVNFTDPKILRLYIQKDKNIKRYNRLSKKRIIESLKFVKSYMSNNGIMSFNIYCMTQKHNRSLPVRHYLANFIDKFFMVWMNFSWCG
jgi:hypothetical protein